jgi:Homeodomain-like domain
VTAKQAALQKYVVKLRDNEREQLNALIHTGKHRAGQLVKARILLKADASEGGEGWSDSKIAAALDTSVNTVARTRQQLVEEGFESVLTRKHSPASARPRIFDGATEAKLIALACSDPPEGGARRTLKLLESAVVELNIVDRASDNTIGRTLKKHSQASPSETMGDSAAFVAGMEDVLEVYQRPHDPECPVVCLDESSKQLISETRVPIPTKPGHPARHDYEYERNGTSMSVMARV